MPGNGYNRFMAHLSDMAYQQAEDHLDLLSGVNIMELRCRVNATVDIAAGGGADGAVNPEGVQRLIKSLHVTWDGIDIVQPIGGRELYAYTARTQPQRVAATNLAGAGIQTTAVSFEFVIAFARRYLANAGATALPAVKVAQELRMYVQWETGATSAGDDAGTAALVTGGTRAITWSVAPTLSVDQVYAKAAWKPVFVPIIAVRNTQQIAAANASLPLELRGKNPFSMALHRYYQGALQNVQDGINRIRLIAGGGSVRLIGNPDYPALASLERSDFVGVAAADQAGSVGILFADHGRLGTIIDPRALVNPQWEYDLDAPTGAPGFVRSVYDEVMQLPPFTL